METSYKIGDPVKLINNPNAVDITYLIEDVEIWVKDGKVDARVMLRPDRDYPHPDGGYITTNNLRDEKITNVKKA